jgi:hypothetical protein
MFPEDNRWEAFAVTMCFAVVIYITVVLALAL